MGGLETTPRLRQTRLTRSDRSRYRRSLSSKLLLLLTCSFIHWLVSSFTSLLFFVFDWIESDLTVKMVDDLFKLFNWRLLLITFSWSICSCLRWRLESVVPGWETSVSVWFFKFGKNFSLKKKWLDVNKNVVRYNHRFQLLHQWCIHKQTLAQTVVNLIAIRISTWTAVLVWAIVYLNLYAGVKVTPSSRSPRLWLNNSQLGFFVFIGELVQCGNGTQQLLMRSALKKYKECGLSTGLKRIEKDWKVNGKKSLYGMFIWCQKMKHSLKCVYSSRFGGYYSTVGDASSLAYARHQNRKLLIWKRSTAKVQKC